MTVFSLSISYSVHDLFVFVVYQLTDFNFNGKEFLSYICMQCFFFLMVSKYVCYLCWDCRQLLFIYFCCGIQVICLHMETLLAWGTPLSQRSWSFLGFCGIGDLESAPALPVLFHHHDCHWNYSAEYKIEDQVFNQKNGGWVWAKIWIWTESVSHWRKQEL